MRSGAHAVIGACATVPLAILFGGSVLLPVCAAAGAIGLTCRPAGTPRAWRPWWPWSGRAAWGMS